MSGGSAKKLLNRSTTARLRRQAVNLVYGCGFGRSGSLFTRSLADGNVKDYWKPRQIDYFNGRRVEHIAAGFGFSVLASGTRLYGGGVDIFSNALDGVNFWRTGVCLNGTSSALSNGRQRFLGRITGLAAGRRHFLVATSRSVYAFGDNAHGQCGRDPSDCKFIRFEPAALNRIDVPSDSAIAQVHCTLDTSFIVLQSGQVFSFGLGTDGQLGRGVLSHDWRCLPVTGELDGVHVRSLRGSTDTLMALTRSGELFMWGQNEYGQMYPFIDDIQSGFPRHMRFEIGQLITADSTATSCVTLNTDGRVFTWGFGVLGFGPDFTTVRRPTPLHPNLFAGGPADGGKVRQIRAGNSSVFAISAADNIFSWGINRSSHLGLAHDKDQYFPYQVPVVRKPLDISVAPDHTLFIMPFLRIMADSGKSSRSDDSGDSGDELPSGSSRIEQTDETSDGQYDDPIESFDNDCFDGKEIEIDGDDTQSQISVSQQFKFSKLCESLNLIRQLKRSNKFGKKRIFKQLLTSWFRQTPNTQCITAYPIIRILANSIDNRKFNMKSKKLIAKMCKVLCLPTSTKNQLLLVDSKSAALAIKQLATEIAARNPVLSQHQLSIHDVNQSLCRITESDLSEEELEVLVRSCSSISEVFWLLNILVRNVERAIGVSYSQMLLWIHPRGVKLRKAGANLQRICMLSAMKKVDDDANILFRMFEPMLLARIGQVPHDIFDKLVHYCGNPFFAELKYDGEHFLVHKKGTQLRYFSRAQNDFTATIAPILDEKILPFFSSTLENCILDTELLLWDILDKTYVGKGRRAADGLSYDVKHLKKNDAVEPCIVIFDILLHNDKSLMDLPLCKRLEYLNNSQVLLKQDKTTIFVSEFKTISSRNEFLSFYEEAVRKGEEGVVAKKMDSVYEIGTRSMANGWFKIKPFHLCEETLDLAVVGVDCGRNGKVENYSVAVLREGKYYSVGKVGTGLDYTTRKFLNSRLFRNQGLMKAIKNVPDWIHHDHRTSDLPTNFIRLDNIQVVEVQAKGILNDRMFAPSLRHHRDDKLIKDIDKYEDFLEYDKNVREYSIANAQCSSEERKRKLELMDQDAVKKTHVDNIDGELKGMQFCVLKGNSKADLQELENVITSFGGTVSANPGARTTFVIAAPNHLKTKAVIKSNKYNVVNIDWVVASKTAGKVIPVSREHAVHVVDESLFSLFIAPGSGNEMALSKKYTIRSVSSMLQKIKVNKRKKPSDAEECLRRKLLDGELFYRFHGQIFYLHDCITSCTQSFCRIMIKLCGGNVSKTLNNTVTHIVVNERENFVDTSPGKTVVDIAWLENSLDM